MKEPKTVKVGGRPVEAIGAAVLAAALRGDSGGVRVLLRDLNAEQLRLLAQGISTAYAAMAQGFDERLPGFLEGVREGMGESLLRGESEDV